MIRHRTTRTLAAALPLLAWALSVALHGPVHHHAGHSHAHSHAGHGHATSAPVEPASCHCEHEHASSADEPASMPVPHPDDCPVCETMAQPLATAQYVSLACVAEAVAEAVAADPYFARAGWPRSLCARAPPEVLS